MAELNFGLLTPPGSENIANAFVRGQDQAQAARLQGMQMQQSVRQGQMAELQFKKAQDAEAKLNQFYAQVANNGGPTDPIEIENQMIGSGVPKVADIGLSARMKRLALEQERKRFAEANAQPGVGVAPAGVNSLSAPPRARTAIDDLNRQIATNMALGTDQGYKNAERLQKQVDALNKRYTVGNTLMGAEGNVIGIAPQQPRLLTPEEEAQRVRIARESRPPAAPRPEQPPIAVIDDTGKTVYVSREEALSRRMTPAAAGEGLPPKEIQKRESVYPTATSAVKGFEAKSEAFIKDLKALRNHPGLSSITGIAAGRLPGMTAEGRGAQALYDKVVAKGGFQALQDLRDASKTGGALGNVSNREGQQLTASFAAIDRRQDAPDVQAAIDGAIAGVEGARIRTREAYDDTYSYKSAAGQAAPSPAAATIPQAAIDALNAGVGTPAQFDAQFGAGAAARVKGKK